MHVCCGDRYPIIDAYPFVLPRSCMHVHIYIHHHPLSSQVLVGGGNDDDNNRVMTVLATVAMSCAEDGTSSAIAIRFVPLST